MNQLIELDQRGNTENMARQENNDNINDIISRNKYWDAIDDKINSRYELIYRIGKGNYGTVWRAIDKNDRSRVAIKKVNNAFANLIDAQRSLREI